MLFTFAGSLNLSSPFTGKESDDNTYCLLVKPKHLSLIDGGTENAQVTHIGVTEQGYHYHLSSINNNTSLAFTQLSFYSDTIFTLEQQVAVQIIAHETLVFLNN